MHDPLSLETTAFTPMPGTRVVSGTLSATLEYDPEPPTFTHTFTFKDMLSFMLYCRSQQDIAQYWPFSAKFVVQTTLMAAAGNKRGRRRQHARIKALKALRRKLGITGV